MEGLEFLWKDPEYQERKRREWPKDEIEPQ
jgi:hypothetical protein